MIDWDRLTELRHEVGEEDFQDVVDIFLDEVDEEIVDLPRLTTPAELEAKLHFLKGSALNIGFSYFADLCQVGENSARNGDTSAVDKAAITTCYKASKSELLSALKRISAA